MMGLFMTAMAVVMLLSGAGIDRSNERKAKNQQTQPAQITYVSESAGTSNEPEQATKQNNEPVLAAEGKNDVTAPAAGINNELAQADEKNEPDVHESMPVYAPVVDEPTPEAMTEVDVAEHNDESAQAEVPDLTADMFYNCNDACRQVAVLNGIDSAEAICGVFGDYNPFSIVYAYEKCARPDAVEGVTAEANKIIDDATTEFEAQWSTQEQQQNSRDVHVVVDMIHSRAKEHGLDLSPIWGGSKSTGSRPDVDYRLKYYGRGLESAWFNVKRVVDRGSDDWMDRHSCEWLTQVGDDCSISSGPRCRALPFCEANKNFPGCEQFLDIYGNCEKILEGAAEYGNYEKILEGIAA